MKFLIQSHASSFSLHSLQSKSLLSICISPMIYTFSFPVRSFSSETQDELEAITNDIKKMANNARNKLKSKSGDKSPTLSSVTVNQTSTAFCVMCIRWIVNLKVGLFSSHREKSGVRTAGEGVS